MDEEELLLFRVGVSSMDRCKRTDSLLVFVLGALTIGSSTFSGVGVSSPLFLSFSSVLLISANIIKWSDNLRISSAKFILSPTLDRRFTKKLVSELLLSNECKYSWMSEFEEAAGVVGISISFLSKNTSSVTLSIDSHGDGDRHTGKEQILEVFLVHQEFSRILKKNRQAGWMDILVFSFEISKTLCVLIVKAKTNSNKIQDWAVERDLCCCAELLFGGISGLSFNIKNLV